MKKRLVSILCVALFSMGSMNVCAAEQDLMPCLEACWECEDGGIVYRDAVEERDKSYRRYEHGKEGYDIVYEVRHGYIATCNKCGVTTGFVFQYLGPDRVECHG